ncbi:MAG: hypothetical protein EOP56_01305 [Sphingobacteriales bacterium]|nr:MAG: hypothetical protein EOP56_01305 [Sphingobacteriales bacterium]
MRKLRLIKPWRLRTIRQRTNGEEGCRIIQDMMVPCSGPRSESTEGIISRATFVDLRVTGNIKISIAKPTENAPHSDAAVLPSSTSK